MLVDTRVLRRFVVRIDSPEERKFLGTGFFAAPGWVVTCAHVVQDLRVAVVAPAVPGIDLGAVSWTVAARSCAPPPGWQSAFWPYPDLAVLRADGQVDHPCPLLEARDPAGDHDCHSWGYAQHETGILPDGSPASFRFEGVTGSGFLQLKAGQAVLGLSGSPLVCPVRRAIVGVVAVTRDTHSDLGGWAAPLSALLTGGEEVPGDLAEVGAKIREANRAAVLHYRHQWNAVLPADADGLLDQPWAKFVRGKWSTPASLLRADFGVVPYLFREAELRQAADWCEGADWTSPMSVMRVTAPGGAGKTRFAIELCQLMQERGWVTGLWRDAPGLVRLPLPRLIVIDYAEEGTATGLEGCLDALARHATALAPVRVLLLTRHRTGMATDALAELGRSAPATLTRVLDHVQDSLAARKALTPEQRAELYREAMRRFTAAWCPTAGQARAGLGDIPDLSHDRYRLPLDVLFEVLDHVLAHCDDVEGKAAADGAAPGSPIERALAHEEKYWRLTAPRSWRDDPEVLRESVVLATLAGAADYAEADSLLAVSARFAGPGAARARHDLIPWLSSLYGESGTLHPLRPDRLGETLVIGFLRDLRDGGPAFLRRLLGLPSDEQAERCLDMLATMSAYDEPVARIAAAAISAVHAELTKRAEAQSRGIHGRPSLAGAMHRLLTPRLCRLIGQELAGNTACRRELFGTYSKLADLAVDAGRAVDAEALYRQCLALGQELADAEPGNATYRHDLAVTYGKLADLAVDARRPADAADLYRRCLAIGEELAGVEPGNATYRHDLVVTYEKLADLAANSGRARDAEALYRRSLDLGHELAAAEPGNATYRRELSVIYSKRADVAVLGGQAAQARHMVATALELRRQLVRAEPERLDFAEELAYALYMSSTTGLAGSADRSAEQETISILEPFEQRGHLTNWALALLDWARGTPS